MYGLRLAARCSASPTRCAARACIPRACAILWHRLQMPDCYYTCNLLPLDLVARAGYTPRWLGNHLRRTGAPARREALSVHPMTCPYVTKLVAAAEDLLGGSNGADTADCLVVPGGCDAARRMGDLLAATYPDQVFVMHMPRSSAEDAAMRLANDLERLDGWLRDRLPDSPASAAPTADSGATDAGAPDEGSAGIQPEPPSVDYSSDPRPGGVFVVSGPLSDDSLLALIDKLGAHVSGLESCTSPDRWRPLTPGGNAAERGGNAAERGAKPDFEAAAAEILATGMCPRRSTEDRRDYLDRRLDEARPSSIIYARQSFCDPGAYDALLVAHLACERKLPFLEIEVDFPFDAGGPLRVRVEAFLEAQLMDEDLLDDDDLFEEL